MDDMDANKATEEPIVSVGNIADTDLVAIFTSSHVTAR